MNKIIQAERPQLLSLTFFFHEEVLQHDFLEKDWNHASIHL